MSHHQPVERFPCDLGAVLNAVADDSSDILGYFTLEEFKEHAGLQRDDKIIVGLRHQRPHSFTAYAFRVATVDFEFAQPKDVELLTAIPLMDIIFQNFLGPNSDLAQYLFNGVVVYCMDHRSFISAPCKKHLA